MAKLSSVGAVLEVSNEATTTAYASATFAQIRGFTAVQEPGSSFTENENSDITDTAKAYILGKQDFGTGTLQLIFDAADVGQIELREMAAAKEERYLKLTHNDASERYFKFKITEVGAVEVADDDNVTQTITFRRASEVTVV